MSRITGLSGGGGGTGLEALFGAAGCAFPVPAPVPATPPVAQHRRGGRANDGCRRSADC